MKLPDMFGGTATDPEALGRCIVLKDGAMATALFARGLDPAERATDWNLSRPLEVRTVHDGFLEAGCDYLQTNTFNWPGADLKAVQAGAAIARAAVEDHGAGQVAGNLGPAPVGASSGYIAERTTAVVEALVAGGVGWISLETLVDPEAARVQLDAALAASDLCVTASFTLGADENETRVFAGASIVEMAQQLEAAGAGALGINCSAGGAQLLRALPELREATRLPLIAAPNAGTPRIERGAVMLEKWVWDPSPQAFAANLVALVQGGAQVVGGCCGAGSEHLAAARAALNGLAN
ncbi:MAG: homocysteine S-methyltransferase family protein [bacterium]|nr:hypothetical protein [Planctomycetota bacterium]HIL50740.1 hypothetical protein [Planctomycetota bacterium]